MKLVRQICLVQRRNRNPAAGAVDIAADATRFPILKLFTCYAALRSQIRAISKIADEQRYKIKPDIDILSIAA